MTALATAIQPLWPLLKAYGEDPESLFRSAAIDPAVLNRINARIPVETCELVWLRASSRVADPSYGVRYGDYWQPSMFGPLGYAWLASRTLRRALARLERYMHLVVERETLEVQPLPEGNLRATLSYEGRPHTLPALADAWLSLLVRLCRLICGESFTPSLVTIVHSAPPNTASYFEYFKCPVEFDADRDSIVIPGELVDVDLPSGNPHLANINEQETIRILAQLDRGRVLDRVKAAVIDELASGEVTIEKVAAKLNVSARTLSRQLQQQGTTFKELLSKLRLQLATGYLSDQSLSLVEIAFMLGFSEQASFSRAYKRWTGTPPSEARA